MPSGQKLNWRGSEEQRFWCRVVALDDGCWLWTGGKCDGWGYFSLTRQDGISKSVKAHNWAYEYCIGPIPDGLELDHLCRNRACVNPWHLEPVTDAINTFRATGNICTQNAMKIFCKHGHRFTESNTYLYIIDGKQKRYCKTCMMRNCRERRAKLKGSL